MVVPVRELSQICECSVRQGVIGSAFLYGLEVGPRLFGSLAWRSLAGAADLVGECSPVDKIGSYSGCGYRDVSSCYSFLFLETESGTAIAASNNSRVLGCSVCVSEAFVFLGGGLFPESDYSK